MSTEIVDPSTLPVHYAGEEPEDDEHGKRGVFVLNICPVPEEDAENPFHSNVFHAADYPLAANKFSSTEHQKDSEFFLYHAVEEYKSLYSLCENGKCTYFPFEVSQNPHNTFATMDEFVTRDPSEVTCERCREDWRFIEAHIKHDTK